MSMPSATRSLAATAFGAVVLVGPASTQQPQPPVFRSGVELVMVDAQVVDRKGEPVVGLRPDQFEVTIDGRRRQVVAAHLIDAATGTTHPQSSPLPDGDDAYQKSISPGTIYVVAIDQGSFRAVNAPSAMHALNEFIKRLGLNDYMGLVSYPPPGVVIDPTRERAPLIEAVGRVVGFTNVRQPRMFQYSLSDALDVTSRDAEARARVFDRNCKAGDQLCRNQLEMEMAEVITTLETQATRSLDGLRSVIGLMRGLEGRKTLVVLSAGLPTGDRTGGRLYMRSHAQTIGKEAADAGILLYTLHMNTRFLDAFSPDAPSVAQTLMRETGVYAGGLDVFNGAAGGTFMEVNTGSEFAIERVIRETSAYYLLAVQPEASDRDGRRHMIRVRVSQRGSQVRNRPSVVIPK